MVELPLRLAGVSKRYRHHHVLRDLSLDVPSGSLFGLVGLNGAGKTTTLRIALGLLSPDHGTATAFGVSSHRLFTISGRIGATLHLAGLDPRLSAEDNLRHHLHLHRRPDVRVDDLLKRLHLAHLGRRPIGSVSQGERQRVAVARAMLLKPDLLILDEPLTHLDPGAVDGVLEVLKEEVRERGATVLLSSHQLDYVERSADRLALIHDGRVLMQGTMDELLHEGERRMVVRGGPVAVIRDGVEQFCRHGDSFLMEERLIDAEKEVVELRFHADRIDAAALNRALHDRGAHVSMIAAEQPSLERLFRTAIRTASLESSSGAS